MKFLVKVPQSDAKKWATDLNDAPWCFIQTNVRIIILWPSLPVINFFSYQIVT